MPEGVTTLSGSCVTVPCSFTLEDGNENKITSGCKPLWLKKIKKGPKITSVTFRGNLEAYDCTTAFNDVQENVSTVFRIECETPDFKYTFRNSPVNIQIKGKFNVCQSETTMYWSHCGSDDAECW